MCPVKLMVASCAPPSALLRDLVLQELQRAGLQSAVSLTVLEVGTYVDYVQNQEKQDAGPEIASCDVLLTDPLVLSAHMPRLLDHAHGLKWAHITWAGVDLVVNTIAKLSKPVPFAITRQVGNFGPYMAEYVIGHIIARERRFFQQHLNQLEKKWFTSCYDTFFEYRCLSSLTIGIVGAGSIGQEVARVCKSLGMSVCGLTREPVPAENACPHIDLYKLPGELADLLEMSDYVCSLLPETPETRGLLDNDILRHCANKKSILINVGRGSVVHEESIIKAIKQGWLGGAILDVFETEPLPEDSPLWSVPEVTITPHCAAASKPDEVVRVFMDNLDTFLCQKPLKHQIDFEKGY